MGKPNIAAITKQLLAGKQLNDSWDGYHADAIAAALEEAGYIPAKSLSACSKASSEYHLKPGKKCPATATQRVEIISASFMGAFTQITAS
jgi:hypothetical protein